jgi:hypothetical protein
MTGDATHACDFADRLVWGQWEIDGGLRRRVARSVPLCAVCGAERPARAPRRIIRKEAVAHRPAALPVVTEQARAVAAELLARASKTPGMEVRARGLLGVLARRQRIRPSLTEEWLEAFLRAGWLGLSWRVERSREELELVSLFDPVAVEDVARPGTRAARDHALAEAAAALSAPSHPVAVEIARLLGSEEARQWDAPLIAALAAVARHAEAGDVLAARVFSTRYLGHSKALASVRGRLETLVGPLEALGIRGGGALTLLGGTGSFGVGDRDLDLGAFQPYLGLSRETILAVGEACFPEAGLLVVENLAAFEACCRGEVPGGGEALVVWSGGYPGRAVRSLAERAARQGVQVRCWADLDLDGVRIARLVASWCPGVFEPWRMAPSDFESVTARLPLSPRARSAIVVDLAANPSALLAATLEAILDSGTWVEQEAMLGR